MATEPETPVAVADPAVPSLVDRYFTRWYKAGKWRMKLVSFEPHWSDTLGTVKTDHKPCTLFPALPSRVRRNWISAFPCRPREWCLQTRGGLEISRVHSGTG